jgi:predicted amidohydrolase
MVKADSISRIILLSVLAGLVGITANKTTNANQPDANEISKVRPAEVKVAAIQCSSTLGDVEANRTKITALVKEAAKEGAKIIVLPEACITGYLSQDLRTNWHITGKPIEPAFKSKSPVGFAEEVPGPSTEHFCKLTKELGVYITVPLLEVVNKQQNKENAVEPNKTTNYYNTVCLVSPKGQIVAHYRKLTPWPHPEKSWATSGDRGVQIYDTEYGRVGLAICYDIHTILEKYKPYKIWALLYPIAWVDESHPADWFWYKLPLRAAKYKHYIIGANWSVDEKQKWYGYGFSEILSPDGKILANSKRLYGSDIIYAVIKTAFAQ